MGKNTELERIYQKHKRTPEKRTLEVDVFLIDDQPVCFSWYGDDDHPRQMCQFMLARHFGSIHVCGLLGSNLDHLPNEMPKIDDNCPLWRVG